MGYRESGRLLGPLVLLSVGLAVTAAVWPASSRRRGDPALTVQVERVPLDATNAGRDRVGALVYRGGLWLRSSDLRFGGISDLRISSDGRGLRAVSDCGRGFTATLAYDAEGSLTGLEGARLIDLVGLDGEPLTEGRGDSESLVATATALEVGFEGKNWILAYRQDPPFGAPARRVATPRGLSRCGTNGGIETMVLLGERRLLVCEARRGPSRDVSAWIESRTGWSEHTYPLLFEGGWGGEPFRPTAAARLPDGDVLVLERRFPPLAARIVRLDPASLGRSEVLWPAEIARFGPPLTLDNFEGIDIRRDGERTLVYLASDDNGCAKQTGAVRSGLQRTLLLMFELEG